MDMLYSFLSWIMSGCYSLCHNYGAAIILFTFFSKLILLPVSLWTYMNSITMIRIQPDIYMLKVRYYGQNDVLAEEQAKLFKKEKYYPLASTIPLIIQMILLVGVVGAIQAGIDHPEIDMSFLGVDLGMIPRLEGAGLIWSPLLAGCSALLLCLAQNASSVLQSEQSKYNKYSTMALSVGLSLYLGWYVPVGTVVYWISSNVMAVMQLYILNWIIQPQKYVDYEKLEKSRRALQEVRNAGKKKGHRSSAEKKRERKDYKKFFSIANKHLVFYSESSGFYKYYRGMIEYLLKHTNLTIHYITSDPGDAIFELEKNNPRIRAYYIGENKLITLMMKMDADMVVMTMPDLENYHIKRSYVRKDIEYVKIPHGMGSPNMTLRKSALDHYDTIFCTGKHQKEEIEKTEAVYGLPKKRLVEFGYPLLDKMREDYRCTERKTHEEKRILIAPSWQADNIMDSCLEGLLDSLAGRGYQITVRPHPQYVRHYADEMEQLRTAFDDHPKIEIQTDFSSNSTVFQAGIVITDWSDIAYEFAYTTGRPVLFINTPMKVMNPEYRKIDTEPSNIWMRERVGRVLEPAEIRTAGEIVEEMLLQSDMYRDAIKEIAEEYVYNLGKSAQAGAEYMIGSLQKKADKRKEEKGL